MGWLIQNIMESGNSNRVTGEFQWLSASVSVNAPERKFLIRLEDITGLEAVAPRRIETQSDLAIIDRRYVRCRQTIKTFHSLHDLLIWTALTTTDMLAGKNQLLLMHAAAWLVDNEVVLLFGEPRNGKSSLSNLALENGMSILGDDVVLIDADSGLAQAAPRPPKQRKSAFDFASHGDDPLTTGALISGRLHGEPCVLLPRSMPRIQPSGISYPVKSIWFLHRCTIPGIRQSIPDRFSSLTRLLSYARDWSTPPLKSASATASMLLTYPMQLLEIGEGQLEEAFAAICEHEGT